MESEVIINEFKGLNLADTGDTNLKLGEASVMVNCFITDDYKLRKREGYLQKFNAIAAKNIQGMWYGKISGSYHFLFACNGFVYKESTLSGTQYDSITTGTNVDIVKTTAIGAYAAGTTGVDGFTILKNSSGTEMTEVSQANLDLVASVGKYYFHTDKTIWIAVTKGLYATIAAARTGLGTSTVYYRLGALTDAKTRFFGFGTKVYIINGTEYLSWSGTGALATVDGYIPLVATATPPAGGGTLNENTNLLTGKKHQTFSGDGASDKYYVAETSIASIDSVYVGGVLKTVTTHYTVDTTLGKVTFTVGNIPVVGVDNVDIYWTKGSGTRASVTANSEFMFFGGQNDTRVFLYGNGNTIIFSDLASGVPSAEYFPANNYMDIGSKEYNVTYVCRQYDKQIIFTEKDTWYATYEYDNTLGANFPVTPVNENIGNAILGQGQVIQNEPVTFVKSNKVYKWEVDAVRDTKDAIYLSNNIQSGLDDLDLSTAITTDFEAKGEYWICIGKKVFIYNYINKTWYYYTLNDTPNCFIEVNNALYMGTTGGQIMVFGYDYKTDNGTLITAEVELGNLSFAQNNRRKFLNFVWVALQPEAKSEAEIEWESDRTTSSAAETIQYNLVDFSNVDYSNETYSTNYNPQPFRLKLKIKKFVYAKIKIKNDSLTHRMTILAITMPALVGGVSK